MTTVNEATQSRCGGREVESLQHVQVMARSLNLMRQKSADMLVVSTTAIWCKDFAHLDSFDCFAVFRLGLVAAPALVQCRAPSELRFFTNFTTNWCKGSAWIARFLHSQCWFDKLVRSLYFSFCGLLQLATCWHMQTHGKTKFFSQPWCTISIDPLKLTLGCFGYSWSMSWWDRFGCSAAFPASHFCLMALPPLLNNNFLCSFIAVPDQLYNGSAWHTLEMHLRPVSNCFKMCQTGVLVLICCDMLWFSALTSM